MTKKQFLDAHRHEFFGMVTDAAITKATGAPLAMFLRDLARKIDQRLDEIYDQLTLVPEPAHNGVKRT